jgi:hypothetical protein
MSSGREILKGKESFHSPAAAGGLLKKMLEQTMA